MAQVKIFGLEKSLSGHREALSTAIHESLMEAFKLPEDKMFQRFFPLAQENFKFPADRSENYTIIEFSIFQGRSIEAKKMLVKLLYQNIKKQVGIVEQDIEITMIETPGHNWGIRGVSGDELSLNYKVEI